MSSRNEERRLAHAIGQVTFTSTGKVDRYTVTQVRRAAKSARKADRARWVRAYGQGGK